MLYDFSHASDLTLLWCKKRRDFITGIYSNDPASRADHGTSFIIDVGDNALSTRRYQSHLPVVANITVVEYIES